MKEIIDVHKNKESKWHLLFYTVVCVWGSSRLAFWVLNSFGFGRAKGGRKSCLKIDVGHFFGAIEEYFGDCAAYAHLGTLIFDARDGLLIVEKSTWVSVRLHTVPLSGAVNGTLTTESNNCAVIFVGAADKDWWEACEGIFIAEYRQWCLFQGTKPSWSLFLEHFKVLDRGQGVCRSKYPFGYKTQGVLRSETRLSIKYSGLMLRREYLGFFGLCVLVSGKPFGLLDSSSRTFEG
ncbi:hypothetical protein SUGI_0637140 [Cryptomeria japonica]|nr:hypothetical protein SUGI_0637140 [Cryptomeria japonica]